MRIILADPEVKAILFNIFGGITRCDDVARGIVLALEGFSIQVPVVVRLTGTNEEAAKAILAQAKGVEPADTMDAAVKLVIARAGGPRA
jgi:succinyl-CoA synthetase beta subunit